MITEVSVTHFQLTFYVQPLHRHFIVLLIFLFRLGILRLPRRLPPRPLPPHPLLVARVFIVNVAAAMNTADCGKLNIIDILAIINGCNSNVDAVVVWVLLAPRCCSRGLQRLGGDDPPLNKGGDGCVRRGGGVDGRASSSAGGFARTARLRRSACSARTTACPRQVRLRRRVGTPAGGVFSGLPRLVVTMMMVALDLFF
jgi:hypothetical protein